MLYFVVKPSDSKSFKTILTFAGSYLFSITLLHLIPELFEEALGSPEFGSINIGACILIGFFFQKVLEYFSSGVEHGHAHHHTISYSPVLLLGSLLMHAFLEGTVLIHTHTGPEEANHGIDLLLGIVLHKAPAAFVLTTILAGYYKKKVTTVLMLMLFALASPLGMLTGNMLLADGQEQLYIILYALVAGNFLHVSTTIFIESNPEHKVELRKMLAIGAGVAMAFLALFFHS